MTRQPWDPDPLTVEPEEVRRAQSPNAAIRADVVLAWLLAVLVILAVAGRVTRLW